jgi:hypothetical protein
VAKAIRFHRPGGPEVLQWESVDVAAPGPGEVLVRHHAVGLNFADNVLPHRPLPGPAAGGHGGRGGRCRARRRRWCQRLHRRGPCPPTPAARSAPTAPCG